MTDAVVLLDEKLTLSERYLIHLTAYKVKPDRRHPEGVKVRYLLLDVIASKPIILVDNHAPYGFHVHERLPVEQGHRRRLPTTDYLEALDEFQRLVAEVLAR